MTATFKTADGSIDWEQVFEHPDAGFVAMISKATTLRGLERVSREIVDKLFVRKNDGERRESFNEILNHLFARAGEDTERLDDVRKRVLMVMRQVKTDRKERQAMAREKKAGRGQEAGADGAAPEAGVQDQGPGDPETVLAEAFFDAFERRFKALSKGIDEKRAPGGKVPYLLSPVFAACFVDVLRAETRPRLARAFRGLLLHAEKAGVDKRDGVIKKAFANPGEDTRIWPAWHALWADLTETQAPPPEPDPPPPPKKRGLLARLLDDDHEPEWDRPMTPEEWKQEVAEVEDRNKAVRAFWAAIVAPDDAYVEPSDDDRTELREVLAVVPSGLEQDVKAIRQIAMESESVGRAFDTFAKRREPDLALMVAAYRDPPLFLDEKARLKAMLASSRGKARRSTFPLTDRFLGPFIQ